MEKAVKELVNRSSGHVSVAITSNYNKVVINEEASMPAASLIKLVILFEACRQIADGQLSGEQQVELDKRQTGGAGVLDQLASIEKLSVWDLLTLMIIVSDNAASNALMKLIGKESLNQACHDMGLRSTVIARDFMDFEAAQRGFDNVTSARDMMRLLEMFFTNGQLAERERLRALKILSKQQSRKLTAALEEEDAVFYGKSGELSGLQADAGVFRVNEELAFAVVFVSGAETPLDAQLLIAKIGRLIHADMKQHV